MCSFSAAFITLLKFAEFPKQLSNYFSKWIALAVTHHNVLVSFDQRMKGHCRLRLCSSCEGVLVCRIFLLIRRHCKCTFCTSDELLTSHKEVKITFLFDDDIFSKVNGTHFVTRLTPMESYCHLVTFHLIS